MIGAAFELTARWSVALPLLGALAGAAASLLGGALVRRLETNRMRRADAYARWVQPMAPIVGVLVDRGVPDGASRDVDELVPLTRSLLGEAAGTRSKDFVLAMVLHEKALRVRTNYWAWHNSSTVDRTAQHAAADEVFRRLLPELSAAFDRVWGHHHRKLLNLWTRRRHRVPSA